MGKDNKNNQQYSKSSKQEMFCTATSSDILSIQNVKLYLFFFFFFFLFLSEVSKGMIIRLS